MVGRERSRNRHQLGKGEVVQALGGAAVKFQRNVIFLVSAYSFYSFYRKKRFDRSASLGGRTACARVLLN